MAILEAHHPSHFLGFLDTPSSLGKHMLCTENKQKKAIF